jgi:hypothetical protein
MTPRTVSHKLNGRRHLPSGAPPGAADLIRLVHSDTPRPGTLTPDLLRFAALVAAETRRFSGSAGDWRGNPALEPLARAVARARAAGGDAAADDLVAGLRALERQAALAAGVVAHLAELVRSETPAGWPHLSRAVVEVGARLAAAAATARGRLAREVAVDVGDGPPRVVAATEQLDRLLAALLEAAAASTGQRPCRWVRVTVARVQGVLQGHPAVRVDVEAHRSPPASAPDGERVVPQEAAARRREVARVAAELGGTLAATGDGDDPVRITLHLPGV